MSKVKSKLLSIQRYLDTKGIKSEYVIVEEDEDAEGLSLQDVSISIVEDIIAFEPKAYFNVDDIQDGLLYVGIAEDTI